MISWRQANIEPDRSSLNSLKYTLEGLSDNLIGYNLHDIRDISHAIPLSSPKHGKRGMIFHQKI